MVEEADGGCVLRDGCELFNGRGWIGFAVPPSASRDADDCPLRFLEAVDHWGYPASVSCPSVPCWAGCEDICGGCREDKEWIESWLCLCLWLRWLKILPGRNECAVVEGGLRGCIEDWDRADSE